MSSIDNMIPLLNKEIVDYTRDWNTVKPTEDEETFLNLLTEARDSIIRLSQLQHRTTLARFYAIKTLNARNKAELAAIRTRQVNTRSAVQSLSAALVA